MSAHCRCLDWLLISSKATLLDSSLEDSYTGVVNCINVINVTGTGFPFPPSHEHHDINYV